MKQKLKKRVSNSVEPDETARDEQSHLDLHCLHWFLYWSAELKGLSSIFVKLQDDRLGIYSFYPKY